MNRLTVRLDRHGRGFIPVLLAASALAVLLTACNRVENPSAAESSETSSLAENNATAPVVTITDTAEISAPDSSGALSAKEAVTTISPLTTTLSVLTDLNIRSGPGVVYPVIGNYFSEAAALVIGESQNRAWLKIECPDELNLEECWVSTDPTLVDVKAGASLPLVAAGPVPTATPEPSPTPLPTPTPCRVAPPGGWSSYTVQDGDTLSLLASRSGASVQQIQQVNCLGSTMIYASRSIFVPTGAAFVAPPPGRPISTDGFSSRPQESGEITTLGLPAALGFGSPNNSCYCPDQKDTIHISIANDQGLAVSGKQVGNFVPICVNNAMVNQAVSVEIRTPDNQIINIEGKTNADGDWRHVFSPRQDTSDNVLYQVTISVADPATSTVRSLQVDPAIFPSIRVYPPVVGLGDTVDLEYREFESIPAIGLYEKVTITTTNIFNIVVTGTEWNLVRAFQLQPNLDDDGWRRGSFLAHGVERKKTYVVWGEGMRERGYSDCQEVTIR